MTKTRQAVLRFGDSRRNDGASRRNDKKTLPVCAMEALEGRLGWRFHDPDLLRQALLHPSATREGRRAASAFERLEFLGDRVVGLIIADCLYRSFPRADEGELARRHTELVRTETLALIARTLCLASVLVQDSSTPSRRDNVLADVCEAVLGALYLDGGLDAACAFIRAHWPDVRAMIVPPAKDAKTQLQEYAQAAGFALPRYEVVGRAGVDHAPLFCVRVSLGDGDGDKDGTCMEKNGSAWAAQGEGGSKRAGEMAAASALLACLRGAT